MAQLELRGVHLKAYANGLEARIGIGQWFRFYNERRPHQALGYQTPAAAWATEVNPVDLPLRLDDAGASPTTPQGQQQQNAVHLTRKRSGPHLTNPLLWFRNSGPLLRHAGKQLAVEIDGWTLFFGLL